MRFDNRLVSSSEAFDAMICFLESYWKSTGCSLDDIAVLLGSLSKEGDGNPVDISMWNNWVEIIDGTIERRNSISTE